ncbi:MAG: hypothetical protein EOM37_11380 [Proteobacteria bacterium]|nr:hypothetical protein [Pseudomonadota bacterium]
MHTVIQSFEARSPKVVLDFYFFTEVSIKANRPEKIETLEDANFNNLVFNISSVVAKDENNNEKYAIQMTIETVNSENNAWSIRLVTFGSFVLDDDGPEEHQKNLVFVLGQNILYGHCREFLANITARGPYDTVYLPTITFVPDGECKKDALSSN